jgi:hypothetical protein
MRVHIHWLILSKWCLTAETRFFLFLSDFSYFFSAYYYCRFQINFARISQVQIFCNNAQHITKSFTGCVNWRMNVSLGLVPKLALREPWSSLNEWLPISICLAGPVSRSNTIIRLPTLQSEGNIRPHAIYEIFNICSKYFPYANRTLITDIFVSFTYICLSKPAKTTIESNFNFFA